VLKVEVEQIEQALTEEEEFAAYEKLAKVCIYIYIYIHIYILYIYIYIYIYIGIS
jgi:hypothetical protein